MSVPSDAAQIRSVTTQYHRPEARGSLADGACVTHCRASGSMHGDLIKVNVRLTSRSRCSLQIVADDNDVIALKGECHKQDAPCVTRSGSPADLARTESGCHRSRHPQPTDTTPSYATTTKVPTHSLSGVVRSIDAPKLVIERPQQYAQYGGNISLRLNLSTQGLGDVMGGLGVIVVRDWTARIPRAPQ